MNIPISDEGSRLIRNLMVASENLGTSLAHEGNSQRYETKSEEAWQAMVAYIANLEAKIVEHEDTDRKILRCMGIGS